jgi:5'-methylthioadenosine phosphorylase
MWALRAVGVRQVVTSSAVGGLRPDLGPGQLVVPDQFVDRTQGRPDTFHDDGAVHVSMADPYCPAGRAVAVRTAAAQGWQPVDGGTLVVVQGPRFSTRAESRWFAAAGWSIVGMTGYPEAALARELAMCLTCVALITDADAGVEAATSVTQEEVFRVFAEHAGRLGDLLTAVVAALPVERTCPCAHALDGLAARLPLP